MKAKKALRKLAKVETLLAAVISKYEGKGDTRELLDSAKATILRARKTVHIKPAPKAAKKPPVKAGNAKKAELAAKTQVAAA